MKNTHLILISLCLLIQAHPLQAEKKVWSEKSSKAKELVQLPSIRPVVEQVDAVVVNIATQAEPKESTGPRQPGQPGPFQSPEEFFERFFGSPMRPQAPRRSTGSGFLISTDGYILTNNHVIDQADKIEVRVSRYENKDIESETYEAKLIGGDPRTDVALIKIEPKNKEKFPIAYLGNSDEMKKGDWVVAVGNPFGLEHSVSVGIISAKGREISSNENRRFDDFIQTDAAINFGNSGGPLVNLKGEVVGINTAITAQGSGIGFAIPINQIKNILPQLKSTGTVSRGYLGVMIQDISEEMKDALGLDRTEGVLINDLVPDGPAAKSALKPGDVIIRVNGEKTPDSRSLQKIIARFPPKADVNLEIIRDKNRRKLSVKLGSLDEPQAAPQTPEVPQETDKLGLYVSVDPAGMVMVEQIDPNSAAFQGGVIPGDQIRAITHKAVKMKISSLKDYKAALSKMEAGDSVVMTIAREQGPDLRTQLFIAFRVPEQTPDKGKKNNKN